MTSFEALAVARMRQWTQERAAAYHGRTTDYKFSGWRARNARLVRIMDFERALDGLNETDQLLLLFKYRDQMPDKEIPRSPAGARALSPTKSRKPASAWPTA